MTMKFLIGKLKEEIQSSIVLPPLDRLCFIPRNFCSRIDAFMNIGETKQKHFSNIAQLSWIDA